MKVIRLCFGMSKFVFNRTCSIHRIIHLPRYCNLYYRMLSYNQNRLQQDLQAYQTHMIKQKSQKSLKGQLHETKNKLKHKFQQLSRTKDKIKFDNLKEVNLQQTIKHYVNKGFEYMGLYYQSLQALVQGKREVLHNKDFTFQDGETVQQKEQKAEKMFRKLIGKKENQQSNKEQ